MKKNILAVAFLFSCIAFSQSLSAQVRVYVNVQPTTPVIVRPAAPAPGHIWVEHEWVVRNGTYVHVPGYWAVPPPGRVRWIPGHWKKNHRHGFYWVPGHWV
ncbi:MAG: YXWGXW repeat-containing protein [Bacteroidetes bacterium]|nr:YXWGXW repeat-containing protein [Bacteroidota bacterium]